MGWEVALKRRGVCPCLRGRWPSVLLVQTEERSWQDRGGRRQLTLVAKEYEFAFYFCYIFLEEEGDILRSLLKRVR